jgi:hypothetical protein
MECCPLRSPLSNSSLFPGNPRKSSSEPAASRIASLRSACALNARNAATADPDHKAEVFLSENERINDRKDAPIYALRQAYNLEPSASTPPQRVYRARDGATGRQRTRFPSETMLVLDTNWTRQPRNRASLGKSAQKARASGGVGRRFESCGARQSGKPIVGWVFDGWVEMNCSSQFAGGAMRFDGPVEASRDTRQSYAIAQPICSATPRVYSSFRRPAVARTSSANSQPPPDLPDRLPTAQLSRAHPLATSSPRGLNIGRRRASSSVAPILA